MSSADRLDGNILEHMAGPSSHRYRSEGEEGREGTGEAPFDV